jgi:hypothetical protein
MMARAATHPVAGQVARQGARQGARPLLQRKPFSVEANGGTPTLAWRWFAPTCGGIFVGIAAGFAAHDKMPWATNIHQLDCELDAVKRDRQRDNEYRYRMTLQHKRELAALQKELADCRAQSRDTAAPAPGGQ